MPTAAAFNPVDPAFIQDPYPAYQFLREYSPVHFEPALGGWFVTRYDDVRTVLNDPRTVRPPAGEMLLGRLPGDVRAELAWFEEKIETSLPFANPPEHGRLRTLVSKAFTPRTTEALRTHVERATDDLLDAMADEPDPDVLRDLAYPLPAIAVTRLLGVPDEDVDGLIALVGDAMKIIGQALPSDDPVGAARAAHVATVKTFDYLEDLIRWRRKAPADDLISVIAASPGYTEEELILLVLVLINGSLETTAHFIGNATLALLRHPAQADLLRRDPSLIDSAVEELLRWDTPVPVMPPQLTTAPIVLSGRRIEAGQLLFPVIGAAHRDPVRYPDPDRLDITRAPSGVLAFGGGVHHCIGASLARAEARVALGKLFSRFPALGLTGVEPVFRADPVLRGLTALPVRL
ncbi:cytochrome P450 [Lentzea tibetensis]|uniref:Cytochrome P450 n=1 Tax=Lentzea tibetensis TaxID=2591470 RepID=A0A563EGP6_9PSEU|nr:cytochrome P450 [Lentzea tibetensis]TWP44993.1 cytochrome P450 [Lentzea tibetensis]